MFAYQRVVLGVVERFDGEVRPVERFGALRGREELEVPLSLRLCIEAAEAVFRHVGGGMPAGHLQRRPLKNTESGVPKLEAPWRAMGAIGGHRGAILDDRCRWCQAVDVFGGFR